MSAPASVMAPRAASVEPPAPSAIGWIVMPIVIAAFGVMLAMHARTLWAWSFYQFFPFVFVGSAVLAWSRWSEVGRLEPRSAMPANLGFVASWLLLMVSEVIVSPALGYVGALIFIMSALFKLGGRPLVRAMLPAWGYLWILVPLPFFLGQLLLVAMQNLATRWSSFVLDLAIVNVFHHLDGNVVEIAGKRLFVEEACSGANSMLSLLACCLFLILWTRQRWYRALPLLLASVVWVLVANAVRIITIAIAYDRYRVDLSSGARHDLLGFLCFALAILLIWSTDRLLLFLFPSWAKEHVDPTAGATRPGPAISSSALLRVCPWPIAAAFALPLVFHLTANNLLNANPRGYPLIPTIAGINNDAVKDQPAPGWKKAPVSKNPDLPYYQEQRTVGAEMGDYSKAWAFQNGDLRATVSLDYPFPAYHDLWICYWTQGWKRDRFVEHTNKSADDMRAFWIESSYFKTGSHFNYVAYVSTNAQGDVLTYQNRWNENITRFQESVDYWINKLSGRPKTRFVPRAPVYQFQVFCESGAPLTEEQREAVNELFFAVANELRGKLFPNEKQ